MLVTVPAAPGLHLPTAVWHGSASPARPEPVRSEAPALQQRPAPAARTIGAANSDEPAERRPPTVAERHGYGRTSQQPTRPVVQPPLPGQPVRPAPKPNTQPPLMDRPVPPQRPIMARAVDSSSNSNGHSNGNGNGNGHTSGNGNGNGHSPSPSRSFDPDLDD